MQVVQLHQLLLFLAADRKGNEATVQAIKRAIDRVKATEGFDGERRAFLRHRHLEAQYKRGIVKDVIKDARALALVLQALQIRGEDLFYFQENRAPWDDWTRGHKVVIVFGGRYVDVPPSPLKHKVVGSQDAQAIPLLANILTEHAGIEFRYELCPVSPNTSYSTAVKLLNTLRRRRDVGAVVVLGSEVVNPMSAPLARRIFHEKSTKIPVGFRWSYPIDVERPCLASPTPCAKGHEGIVLSPYEDDPSIPRMRDEEVLEAIKRGECYFPDAGVLAISRAEETILVLCAGHGGCGTTAAVLGLSRVDYVERALVDSIKAPRDQTFLPRNTILEPVWVDRRKESDDSIDDFSFQHAYGKGWGFYMDEDTERPPRFRGGQKGFGKRSPEGA